MDEPQFIMSSPRLRFRRLRADDFALIAPILQDEQTMYAWEHSFSYDEMIDWIADALRRYREDDCGYLAAIDRQTGELIGLAGALQEQLPDGPCIGIGYIIARKHWRQGYGLECAQAALHDAFTRLGADRVVATIRPDNLPSRAVAECCGMKPAGEFVKLYQGKELLHLIYEMRRPVAQ